MLARTIIAFGALALVGALPASAAVPTATSSLALTSGDVSSGSIVLARHGADDPADHDANDDKGGKRKHKHGAGHASIPASALIQLARHGADDAADHDAGDDRGGKKRRHGAGHA